MIIRGVGFSYSKALAYLGGCRLESAAGRRRLFRLFRLLAYLNYTLQTMLQTHDANDVAVVNSLLMIDGIPKLRKLNMTQLAVHSGGETSLQLRPCRLQQLEIKKRAARSVQLA